MTSSHGTKPAVGPYRFRDPDMLRRVLDKLLRELVKPWQGDRLSEAQMRGILTAVWFTQTHLDGETMVDNIENLAMIDIENMEEVDGIPDAIASLLNITDRLQARWDGVFPAAR